jgi:hypothetical protein
MLASTCLLDPLSPVLPWATVPEGVYDPADHLVVRKAIPSTPQTAFQEMMNAMRRASQKHLPKPRPDDAKPDADAQHPGPRIRFAPLNFRKTIRERFPAVAHRRESGKASARPELENSQDPKRTRSVQDFLQCKFMIEAHFASRKSVL